MSLEKLVSEVQRKIGRNILLFQQLEYLLKYVVATGSYSGYVSELEDVVTSKKDSVNKQTMGQLVGKFIENTNPSKTENFSEPDELKEAYISVDFCITSDESSYVERKESLSKLVRERNVLVHHLLPSLDLTSIDSCKKIENCLDEQCDNIRLEINNVQLIVKALSDGREKMSDFFGSDEGKKELMASFLRQDRLVILLAEITGQVVRGDGWTLMSEAARLVKEHAPSELALLHKGTEHKSLKALMIKTNMFEFSEEKTRKGGIRVLYKLKDGYELSYA